MTMTTVLCEGGSFFDFDLHEERLKEGCRTLGLAWPVLELPAIKERTRLKITITEEGVSYQTEPCLPYSAEPLVLNVRVDTGVRCKSPATALRRSWGDLLTVDARGHVLQASCANLFWVHEGRIMTPCNGRLPLIQGTALKRLLKIFPYTLVTWTLAELLSHKPPLFLCNAIREIVPVRQVEDTLFPIDSLLHEGLLGQYRAMRYAHKICGG